MPMYRNARPSKTHGEMPSWAFPMTSYQPGLLSSPSATVSPYSFTVKVLTNWIQICQPCHITFHSTNTEEPFDLVVTTVHIKHREVKLRFHQYQVIPIIM